MRAERSWARQLCLGCPAALDVERDSHGVATPLAATSFPGGCVSSIDKFPRNIRVVNMPWRYSPDPAGVITH